MLKGNDVIGIPLVVSDNEIDGQVEGWIFHIATNQILGFLISRGGWMGGARILFWDDVRHVSDQALITEYSSPVIDVGRVMKLQQVLADKQDVTRMTVITRQGHQLGEIDDIYFDEESGAVVGLLVLTKTEKNLSKQSIFMPVFTALDIMNDFVIATPQMINQAQTMDQPDISFFT